MSIAPGEGKKPLSILQDTNFEELGFPTLFPTGQFGYTCEREVKLSAKKYFQRRLLEKNGNFASNIEYLFVAQFVSEWKEIKASISVALRKSLSNHDGEACNAAFFRNSDYVRPLITKDDAYRFLRPIRGSPPYWQKIMFELLAAIKQFKIFTWFLTLSAADMKWEDSLIAISRQQGKDLSTEELAQMTWEERCSLLRSNPTTAARHFYHRVQCLFTDVILSPACPLGTVTRYFYRIEFQQRGSPHVHCVLWIKNAPQPSDSSKNICEFVDNYIQSNLPSDDDNLCQLVKDLQTHRHTATCTKRGGACRFGYPRPVSEQIVMSRPELEECDKNCKRSAIEILGTVKQYLQDHESELDVMSVNDVLQKCYVSSDKYYNALQNSSKTPIISLRRVPSETCINNYNPHILRLWKANMDLQYTSSPYAAIAYVTSYVTKDEREVGTVLQAVSREMRNHGINEQMKKVAYAFSNARNVSAQEAAYRILGLPLHKSNFTTIWLPSGFPENRIRILKSKKQLDALDDEDEDVFATNILDRYSARPKSLKNMCLAEFGMWYDTDKSRSNNQSDNDHLPTNTVTEEAIQVDIQLNDSTNQSEQNFEKIITLEGLGNMKKRCSQAVVRYHQCSQSANPELYSYNRMLHFMPWFNEQSDLIGKFNTFSEHYESKKNEIESTFARLMKNDEIVTEAISHFQDFGPPTHTWDEIAPETEHVEAQLVEEGYESDDAYAIVNPDSNVNATFTASTEPSGGNIQSVLEVDPQLLSNPEYYHLVQSLNFEQRCAFEYLLRWCHQQKGHISKVIDPQYIFITGGAGTGKSHVISAIFNMANRELREVGAEPDKPKIILTAPTGTAAFNINGCTIHSALQLPTKMNDTYQKLSDSTCNRLRVQLAYLKILIIDEISMVSSGTFNYIDKRLQQIKDSTQPFGGITVVAVGDLYQLRPVGKYVFELSSNVMMRIAGSLWQSHFHLMELCQIMRQKDDSNFAALLNRVRQGEHTEDDIKILQDRCIDSSDQDYNRKALHIFATNLQTDQHNNDRLRELGQPVIQLTRRERRPASLENYTVSDNPTHTGGLVKTLHLCVGARVMVIRNIDVQDGLVNGAQGQVIDFLPNNDNVQAILVKFDKPNIGLTARNASSLNLNTYQKDAVPISRIDVQFSTSFKRTGLSITWTQFPLKLAFACTIHKVQGLSVDELVVSFKKKISGGQAYVALSRCRSIQGLQILDFDPQKIMQNSSVKREMIRLRDDVRLPSPYIFMHDPLTCRVWTISLLNARSLRLHFNDVLNDPITKSSDLLMYTETHIFNSQAHVVNILDYDLEIVQKDTEKHHHGLACYWHNPLSCERILIFEEQHIETLQMKFEGLLLILLYRSPSVSLSLFISDLNNLLSSLQVCRRTIILGDFNVDAIGPSNAQLSELMGRYNFTNINSVKTHIQGSCLDHVYLSLDLLDTYHACYANPTYYSDHYYVTLHLQRPSD